ncbi:uncharacterized protein LOC135226372 [Macrobrachium nipponense]|uniref:uncharacterized protein LOC135226372 n=1 Tax=Macrobrachium nipponense TaxID=159736 RepID=UPI0030C8CB2D
MAVSEGIDVASNENRANDTSVANETWQRKDETESVEERLSMGENDVILNQDTSIVSSANSSHPSTNHSDSYGQVVLNDTTTHEPWAPPAAPVTTRLPPPPPPPPLPFAEIQTTPTPNSTSSSLLLSSLASSSKPLLETTMPTLILSAITKSSHPDQTQEAMKDSEGPPPRSSNTILQPANSPAAAAAEEIRPTESSPPSEASSQSTARSAVLMAPTALPPTALKNTTAPVLTTKTGKPRKRKLQSRDSEPGWAAESLTRPMAAPDVCSNDPCGAGIACHPTNMTSEGFTCICPDNKKIRPGDNCTIETVSIVSSTAGCFIAPVP